MNGDVFMGEFVNNQADGIGVYYVQGGDKVIGRWEKNKLI